MHLIVNVVFHSLPAGRSSPLRHPYSVITPGQNFIYDIGMKSKIKEILILLKCDNGSTEKVVYKNKISFSLTKSPWF